MTVAVGLVVRRIDIEHDQVGRGGELVEVALLVVADYTAVG